MKFAHLSIGTRLAAGFAVILALGVAIALVAVVQLREVGAAKEEMLGAARKKSLAEEWLRGISTNAVRTVAKVRSADAADQRYYDEEMKATSQRVNEVSRELGERIRNPEARRLFGEIGELRKVYFAERDRAFAMKKDGQALADAPLREQIDQRMLPAMHTYNAAVGRLATLQDRIFDESTQRIDAAEARVRLLTGLAAAAMLAVGAVLAWRLARGITRPMGAAVRTAQAVARGELTVHIENDARDETGRLLEALDTMAATLRRTVGGVRQGAEAIALASREIAAGNLDLSARTEQQAATLEETAASMEELTSTVRQNADNARQASTLTGAAAGVARDGGSVMHEMVATMQDIDAASRRIGDIISVIDGIAFQTNILALNAAVEAARAGEQGRGFAVVAAEVRTLAQRSAAAAREIKGLIEDSSGKVDTGTRLVGTAGATMEQIVASVQRVADIVDEIALASEEQRGGIEQVNRAIAQMDEATQQNAALVEQSAKAAEAMQQQAAALAEAVGVFRTGSDDAPIAGPVAAPHRLPPVQASAPGKHLA